MSDLQDARAGRHRLFIAVALPPEPLAACRDLISAVSSSPSVLAASGRVRWTQPRNLHLTLRFLGATDPALVPDVEAAMEAAVSRIAPFAVTLAGTGAFPSSGPPRTLWLGVSRGGEELAALAEALDAQLAARLGTGESAGAPAPNGAAVLHPHLTVARAARGQADAAAAAAAALRLRAAAWTATFDVLRIELYRSHLGSGPPRYEQLASTALAR